ncbi:Dynein heavy chain 17, axonemal [Talaromyces islandicus]|uniref:Dynein heavy chain 17, axonemal n=1 Tax=Talaromyces islandicus TaxID=28573 RepID=A0A0U1M361_TALIS|nr:Dynein heavy chain 17, axonemal [Talaromyces islandicus]
MSLVNLANMCSHLNNVTKARLGLASIPSTKMHLMLLLSMQNQGLIGSVVRAGKVPPPPHLLTGMPEVGGSLVDVEPVTQENIASRRLWLGLKYWQSEPVLGKITPVSKPKHRITLDVPGLRQVLTGQKSGRVDGLRPSHNTQETASASMGELSPVAILRHAEERKRGFASAFSTEGSRNAGDLGESVDPDAAPQTAQVIENLQERVRQLEDLVSAGRATDQIQGGSGASRASITPARNTIHNPNPPRQGNSSQTEPGQVPGNSSITDPLPHLRISSQKTKLFGANHWVNTATQFQVIGDFTAKDIEFSFAKDDAADFHTDVKECFNMRQSWKMQRSNEITLPTMDLPSTFPQRELCDELIQCYMRTFEPIYRLVHTPTFWKEYEQFWTDPSTSSTHFVMKLSLVFTIGTVFYKDESTRKYLGRLARQWLYAAQWWLIGPSEQSTFNLDGLQICCLVNLARQAGCLSSPLWISSDSMLRMAMMMGLHRNTRLFPNLSPFQIEMRNRLWTTVVELYTQSVMDSGVPCLLSLEDVDSVSPSNINDADISLETKTNVKSKSDQTFTDSSIQILLANSIRLRLEVARLINKPVREDLTYENALRLGKELNVACRGISTFFQEHRSVLESQESQVADFHRKFLDMLLRRYILFLHRPFMIEARKDPRYYLSRKICVESCLVLSSYTERLDTASGSQKDLSYLALSGNASFKGPLCMDVISVLGLEITMQIEEENSLGLPKTPHSGGDPLDEMAKASRAPLMKTLECIHSQLEQTLEFGIPSCKRYNYLAGVLALIRALESGLPVKQTIYEDIKAYLKRCIALFQKSKADENSGDIAMESLPSDIGDLASLLPMEDWNLNFGMNFSDYLGFPGFVEQPSSFAW